VLNRFASRRLSWILLAVVATVALVYAASDGGGTPTNEERAAALASRIACPKCDGQAASDSNVAAAVEVRAEIKRLVDEGRSDDEIVALMVASYGEFVDLSPSTRGWVGVVWIAPFLVIGLAAGGLAIAFGRWRAMGALPPATADDEALVARAIGERGEARHREPGAGGHIDGA
jgi:cytochrome c-type biogenesis protein CcmH